MENFWSVWNLNFWVLLTLHWQIWFLSRVSMISRNLLNKKTSYSLGHGTGAWSPYIYRMGYLSGNLILISITVNHKIDLSKVKKIDLTHSKGSQRDEDWAILSLFPELKYFPSISWLTTDHILYDTFEYSYSLSKKSYEMNPLECLSAFLQNSIRESSICCCCVNLSTISLQVTDT